MPKSTRDQWSEHVIDLARIRPFLHQKYRTLSGGQMRRIALAEELIGDPAFLFLDELTSGLDPYSEHELMVWLKDLAHNSKKDDRARHARGEQSAPLRLGRSAARRPALFSRAPTTSCLRTHQTESIEAIYGGYQHASAMGQFVGFDADRSGELPPAPEPHSLNTAPPPGSFSQLITLVRRQNILIWRDKAQIWLHLALLLSFPALVAIFATNGLPEVQKMSLDIQTNVVQSLAETLNHMQASFSAAALVSGLSMFQVILLALMGANNGAREIAKERDVLEKELRAGLSPWAYVTTKVFLVVGISLAQAFWMTWFVKTVCGFKGDFINQFEILFATTLAMSVTCLAISSASKSPERASLLAIYLVGLQLPLSGAVLALPDAVSMVCRPFIAAYWGWSGYLQTLKAFRLFDTVEQSTKTAIADFNVCLLVLSMHALVCAVIAWIFVARSLNRR